MIPSIHLCLSPSSCSLTGGHIRERQRHEGGDGRIVVTIAHIDDEKVLVIDGDLEDHKVWVFDDVRTQNHFKKSIRPIIS